MLDWFISALGWVRLKIGSGRRRGGGVLTFGSWYISYYISEVKIAIFVKIIIFYDSSFFFSFIPSPPKF